MLPVMGLDGKPFTKRAKGVNSSVRSVMEMAGQRKLLQEVGRLCLCLFCVLQ